MPEDKQISTDTKIVFTIGAFLGTVGSILTFFIGFYFMIINPRIERNEITTEKLLDNKIETINIQLESIRELISKDHEYYSNTIEALKNQSSANTHRFRDVQEVSTQNQGSSASSDSSNSSESN